MTAQDAWSIAGAVIMSLGGGGVIVWFLSNFLDKVWANRIMQEERTIHQQELAKFKEELRTELLIEGQRRIEAHQDKIVIYRGVTDAVAPTGLGEAERALLHFEHEAYSLFVHGRLVPVHRALLVAEPWLIGTCQPSV